MQNYANEGGKSYGKIDKTFVCNDEGIVNTTWFEDRQSITTINIAQEISPIDMSNYFSDLGELTQISNVNNLKTNNVISMQGMFRNCSKLQQIDLTKFELG